MVKALDITSSAFLRYYMNFVYMTKIIDNVAIYFV